MEISGLLAREFKISVIKKLPKVWRVMHEQSENFSRDRKYEKRHRRNKQKYVSDKSSKKRDKRNWERQNPQRKD